jgi:hypothetical protein
MGQKGFFDVERRLEANSAKGDPLETIEGVVRWEDFRADIEAVTETKPEERKSNAGRKPYDTILKFKIVVLQSLHNLSDEQTEYLIRDRLSFMRFLDLELEDPVPDATTIWLFREALAEAGLIDVTGIAPPRLPPNRCTEDSRAKSPKGNTPYDLSPGDRRSHDAPCGLCDQPAAAQADRRSPSAGPTRLAVLPDQCFAVPCLRFKFTLPHHHRAPLEFQWPARAIFPSLVHPRHEFVA